MFHEFIGSERAAEPGRSSISPWLILALLILVAVVGPGRVSAQFAGAHGAPDEVGFLPPEPPRQIVNFFNRPDVLNLEPAIAQAELILVVRLADVTESKIVHGGRQVQVTEQYRLEPVRVLKGIFARDDLLMTGQDLGIYQFAEKADRLEPGQLLLILLGRQGQGYVNCNCNGVPTLGQSIPRLESDKDPLLKTVEILIGLSQKRDRADRVVLIRDGLRGATGRAASPLLLALGRRAFLAARRPGVAEVVLPFLKANSPGIREVAARTVANLLETLPSTDGASGRSPELDRFQTDAAQALSIAIANTGPDITSRVTLIEALASAGGPAIRRTPSAVAWLDAKSPSSSYAELAARMLILGKMPSVSSKDEVAQGYEGMLLDAPAEFQLAAGRAYGRLDSGKAAGGILQRLVRKDDAGLDVALEIGLMGELPREVAVPALLSAWRRSLDIQERLAFAKACASVADARLIPSASTLMDPRQWHIRSYAMEALRRIDTPEAASALAPHLDEEIDVSRKLRLIAFLGRHGQREGYPQAVEQLSQPMYREDAVSAVVAIGDPKVIPELRRIWLTSHDLSWNSAAIRALARLGQPDIAPKLLEIARTPGDPLADSALIGLGDLGAVEALPIVREALASRRDPLVIAAARAAAKLLTHPELNDDGIRDRLASLIADSDASPAVREAAFRTLASLHDSRLSASLAVMVQDANLEGMPLLDEVEHTLARPAPAPIKGKAD